MGIIHFFAIFIRARYIGLNMASFLGNEAMFFVTFLSDMLNDSMVLAV